MRAAGCYGIIVLRCGGACLVVNKADEHSAGGARARVSRLIAVPEAALQIARGWGKGRGRAQKVGRCASRVVNNVLRAQKGWGTTFGDVGVGRRWGGRSSRRGRASSEGPHNG